MDATLKQKFASTTRTTTFMLYDGLNKSLYVGGRYHLCKLKEYLNSAAEYFFFAPNMAL